MLNRALVLIAVAATGCTDELELGTATSELDLRAFVLPPASAEERAGIVHGYDLLDPDDEVPRGLLEDRSSTSSSTRRGSRSATTSS